MSYRHALCLGVFGLALAAVPANAAVLFSDLGTGSNVYSTAPGAKVENISPFNIAQAQGFTVAGAGQFNVTQIDLGVLENSSSSTFNAALWTSSSGLPGTLLGSWTLTTTAPGSTCCILTTQTGITGVTVTGGTQYFMVLKGVSNTDVAWQANSAGTINPASYGSPDGGTTWIHENGDPTRAFDVLGNAVPPPAVPEPASMLLLGGGLAGVFAAARRKARRPA